MKQIIFFLTLSLWCVSCDAVNSDINFRVIDFIKNVENNKALAVNLVASLQNQKLKTLQDFDQPGAEEKVIDAIWFSNFNFDLPIKLTPEEKTMIVQTMKNIFKKATMSSEQSVSGSDRDSVSSENISTASKSPVMDEGLNDLFPDLLDNPSLVQTLSESKESKIANLSLQQISDIALKFAYVVYDQFPGNKFTEFWNSASNDERLKYYFSFAHEVAGQNNITPDQMRHYLQQLQSSKNQTLFLHTVENDIVHLNTLLHPSAQSISRLAENFELKPQHNQDLTWDRINDVYHDRLRIPVDRYQLTPKQKNILIKKVNQYFNQNEVADPAQNSEQATSRFVQKLRKRVATNTNNDSDKIPEIIAFH